MKAVVVGGGFAGLSAGYRLRKAGWDVVLLESGAEVGGRVHSYTRDGYIIETGATQMSTGYKEYMALAQELGMAGEMIPSSNIIAVLRRGRLYEIDGRRPLAAAFSGLLSLPSKLLMLRTVRDFLALKPKLNVLDLSLSHSADTESALEYCERRLNREIYDTLVDPMIRGYTLNRADNVSALEWFSSLGNLAGQTFMGLKGGNQRMPEALASRLNVRTGTPVTDIAPTNSGVAVGYLDQGQRQVIQADACVVATKLPDAIRLAPSLEQVVAPLSGLKYNATVLVHLGYRRATKSKALGVLLGAAEHPNICLVWMEHNKDPGTAPPGYSQITCYFDASGLDVGARTDDDYKGCAIAFIAKIFPDIADALDLAEVSYQPLAIPNPATGTYRAVHEMKRRIDSAGRIQLAGDYFTCTGQNSAIYWGRRAAENLIGANHGKAS